MKKLCIFISIMVVALLTSCSIISPKIIEMQGQNEDNNISVKANAKWNSDKEFYEVGVKIHNKTNKMIQLLFDCSDLISYPGKTYESGCNDAYSIGIEEGEIFTDHTDIPEKFFKVNDEIFNISIRYQLDIDNPNIKEIKIPLKVINE